MFDNLSCIVGFIGGFIVGVSAILVGGVYTSLNFWRQFK